MVGNPLHRIRIEARPVNADRDIRRALAASLLFSMAVGLLFLASPTYAQTLAGGPFMQRDQFPIRMLFLGLRPEPGDLLPRHAVRLAVRMDYANTYASTFPVGDPLVADDYYRAAPANEYRLFVDSETLRASVDLDWRAATRLQFGMTLPFLKHGGGFLDGVIEEFHYLFRLSNGGREWSPRNDYGMFVVRDHRFWIMSTESPAFRPGDLVLRVKTPLNSGNGAFVLSLAGAVKLPTGNLETLTGSGGLDFQASLFGTWRPKDESILLHGNLAHTRLGRPSLGEGFPLRPITTLMLAFEYRTTRRLATLVQAQVNIGPFPGSDLGPLDRTAFEITAGVRYATSESVSLDIGVTENLSQYQNTPDVGLHAAIAWTRP